jgi:hypothetical protein
MPRKIVRKKIRKRAIEKRESAQYMRMRIVIVTSMILFFIISVAVAAQYKEQEELRVLGEKTMQFRPAQDTSALKKLHQEALEKMVTQE